MLVYRRVVDQGIFPETNSSPLKIARKPKRNGDDETIVFQAPFLCENVSFRESPRFRMRDSICRCCWRCCLNLNLVDLLIVCCSKGPSKLEDERQMTRACFFCKWRSCHPFINSSPDLWSFFGVMYFFA